MFLAVFFWDLAIVRAAAHPLLLRYFVAHIRLLERITGAVLLSIAAALCWPR